jgi:hypothetical protein
MPFLFLVCFYPSLVVVSLVFFKHRDGGFSKEQFNKSMKLLLVLASIVLIIMGVVSLASLSLVSFGGSLILIALYLLVQTFIP